MGKGRLEAFSDGVIAIIITIMVLELKVPHSADLSALWDLGPIFLSYVLSFACGQAREWQHALGQSPPAVLAFAVSVYHRLDG